MRSRKPFVLLVFFSTALLIAFSIWTVKNRPNISSFQFFKIIVCEDVDEHLHPTDPVSAFDFGVRQLCLWFSYGSAREGDVLAINWYFKDYLVHNETVRIKFPKGIRMYYLLRGDGAPLPVGEYRVVILVNDSERNSLEFTVSST